MNAKTSGSWKEDSIREKNTAPYILHDTQVPQMWLALYKTAKNQEASSKGNRGNKAAAQSMQENTEGWVSMYRDLKVLPQSLITRMWTES